MKIANYSTEEKELIRENKVVVRYNEEGCMISRPSSLADNDNDEYYLTRNNLNHLRRYRSKKLRSRSCLSSDHSGVKNISKDKNKRLKNHGRFNSLI